LSEGCLRNPDVEAADVVRASVGLVSLVVDGDLSDAVSADRLSPLLEAMMSLAVVFLRTSSGDY